MTFINVGALFKHVEVNRENIQLYTLYLEVPFWTLKVTLNMHQ